VVVDGGKKGGLNSSLFYLSHLVMTSGLGSLHPKALENVIRESPSERERRGRGEEI